MYLLYSNETWYHDAPLHHLPVHQISKHSDNLFPLYGNFNTFMKRRRKKNEETKPIFGSSYVSWKFLARFSWNLKCGVLTVEGISTAKIVRFRKSTTKVHIRENRIIVLPINILTGVAHRLLGPHDTLPCVLIHALMTIISLLSSWSDTAIVLCILLNNTIVCCQKTF